MLRTLSEKLAPEHTALLLVDVQNDFCSESGALAGTGADVTPVQEMVKRVSVLLQLARASGVLPVFLRLTASRSVESDPWVEQRLRRAGEPYRRWCSADEWASDFFSINPEPGEPVVDKYRYSAFEGTSLGHVLRAREIKTLVVVGVATNVCVDTAVREANARDFYVVVPRDCTAGTSVEAHEATLKNIGMFFCEVVDGEDIRDTWRRAFTPTEASVVESGSG